MTHLEPDPLRRMLRQPPAAEPPDGLLEELRRQIPTEIQPPSFRPASHGVAPFGGPIPPRLWLAAASVIVALGGGLLGWLVFERYVTFASSEEAAQVAGAERVSMARPAVPPADVTRPAETDSPGGAAGVAAKTAEAAMQARASRLRQAPRPEQPVAIAEERKAEDERRTGEERFADAARSEGVAGGVEGGAAAPPPAAAVPAPAAEPELALEGAPATAAAPAAPKAVSRQRAQADAEMAPPAAPQPLTGDIETDDAGEALARVRRSLAAGRLPETPISAPAMVAAVDDGPPALVGRPAVSIAAVRDPWRGPNSVLLRVSATAPLGGDLVASFVVDPAAVERWNVAGSPPVSAAAKGEQAVPLVGGGGTARTVALFELSLRDGVEGGLRVIGSLRLRWRVVMGTGEWREGLRTLRGEAIVSSWSAAPAALRTAALAGRFAEVLATASTGDGAAQDALADLARRAEALPPAKGSADDLARTIARAREIHAREIPARAVRPQDPQQQQQHD